MAGSWSPIYGSVELLVRSNKTAPESFRERERNKTNRAKEKRQVARWSFPNKSKGFRV